MGNTLFNMKKSRDLYESTAKIFKPSSFYILPKLK